MKSYSLLLIFISFSLVIVQAQSDSSKVFESSFGKWVYPFSNISKIETSKDFEFTYHFSPSISFYSNTNTTVNAVFDGQITCLQQIEDIYIIITMYGEYFIVYSGLSKPIVKKGDFIKAGQPISNLAKDYDDLFRLEIYLCNFLKYLDPYPWFRQMLPITKRSRNSGGHLPASPLVQIPALVSRVDVWSDRAT